MSKNGFRNDDFTPYLYMTTDYGQTWKAIKSNLPTGAINVVVQDRKNRNLLVIGNDFGVFVSIDLGGSWTRLKANLPAVAVHDLTIHPREGDLVLGTYGRGFWTGDITPLQDLSPDTLRKSVHLFDIEAKTKYNFGTQGANFHLFGDKYIEVPNEPDAMIFNYWIGTASATGEARLTVSDISGRTVAQLTGSTRPGLNRVQWPMTIQPASAPGGASAGQARGGGGRGGGGGTPAPLGEYLVTLEVGGEKVSKTARVRERIW